MEHKARKIDIPNFPGQCFWFKEVGSTSDVLREWAEADFPEWTVVVAERQTAGRGRYQRRWESPAGMGLWFSLLLRPELSANRANLLNIATAVFMSEFLEQLAAEAGHALSISLKWPNDLVVPFPEKSGKLRKLGGILLEGRFEGRAPNYLVVGIGINLNQQLRDFPPELRSTAVSLRQLTGASWNIPEVLRRFLPHYYRKLTHTLLANFQGIVEAYRKKVVGSGQRVIIRVQEREVAGIMRGVDENGFLRLETEQGIQVITAGELWEMTSQSTEK